MALDPNLLQTLKLAMAAHQSGRLDEAASHYHTVLRAKPDQFDALHFLGLLEAQRGRLVEADRLVSQSLTVNSQVAEAYSNHASILNKLKRSEDALASCSKALKLRPQFAEVLIHRGNALQELRRHEDALAAYDHAHAIAPTNVMALTNRGNALRHLRRTDEALAAYQNAVAIQPNFAEAHNNRGALLMELERFDEAAAAFTRLLQINPNVKYGPGFLLYCKLHACEWRNLADDIARLTARVRARDCATDPGILLSCSANAGDQLQCAQTYVADRFPASAEPLWRGERYRHDRIRVAYLSGELREHPVTYLMVKLFELHDRSRFEFFAVSTGFNDGSAMRSRLEGAFEHFIDGSAKSDRELAVDLRAREIDIVVDLSGHFGTGRTGALAFRPCPVQVNYLGYPGTMGAPYIDYILADRTVIPADMQAAYSEQAVYLPDQFLANDSGRAISDHTPTRAEAGLPETGFVFCCFNNSYKIQPEIFDIWMRLVRATPGSVLWMRHGNAIATRNLRAEAAKRGVSDDRIIVAPRVAKVADHLARQRLADLFLDTLPFNAHTTASDALWAGLPVLTCLGSTFAGRVAGSLLQAVGLPELMTHSLADYEALAMKLASDPSALADIKAKLSRHRTTQPLFDTQRFRQHIERAYVAMWERQQRGEKPASFAVDPVD